MINALKTPAFLRPHSRPSSPLRRPTPLPTSTTPAPSLVQDGTYLEMLSLKFSEAVSKALSQPSGPAVPAELLAGKRPLPAGRGEALGAVIASELNAARNTPHLHRAIIRSLHRPLSVLLNNLSSILLPLLASPAFLSPAAPTPHAPLLNATQVHALAIAKFAEELLQVFDQLELGLNDSSDTARGLDGLKSIREGLVSLINKIITPLVTGIRNELIPLVESLERGPAQTIIGSPNKNSTTTKLATTINHHPAITQLQSLIPLYARALARYTTSSVAQPALANLLISVLWKALVALSNRADISPTPPPSPTVLPTSSSSSALPGLGGKKRRGSPPSTTPPATPPASRFMLKLPPSRPPSPPMPKDLATPAGDCKALLELMNQLPRPSSDGSSKLAAEAVDEAFKGLKALAVFLEVLQSLKPHSDSAKSNADLADELISLAEELPTLIALPPLLRMYACRDVPSVSEITGLSEEDYRRGILSGFGRAEECADGVGMRVRQRLDANPEANDVVIRWLDLELDLH